MQLISTSGPPINFIRVAGFLAYAGNSMAVNSGVSELVIRQILYELKILLFENLFIELYFLKLLGGCTGS
jgi:hypothetical protein